MDIDVSDESLLRTTNCEKGFSCLKGNEADLCKVVDCIGGTIHLIECPSNLYCAYQYPRGDRHICACPVRKEIYNTYGI